MGWSEINKETIRKSWPYNEGVLVYYSQLQMSSFRLFTFSLCLQAYWNSEYIWIISTIYNSITLITIMPCNSYPCMSFSLQRWMFGVAVPGYVEEMNGFNHWTIIEPIKVNLWNRICDFYQKTVLNMSSGNYDFIIKAQIQLNGRSNPSDTSSRLGVLLHILLRWSGSFRFLWIIFFWRTELRYKCKFFTIHLWISWAYITMLPDRYQR